MPRHASWHSSRFSYWLFEPWATTYRKVKLENKLRHDHRKLLHCHSQERYRSSIPKGNGRTRFFLVQNVLVQQIKSDKLLACSMPCPFLRSKKEVCTMCRSETPSQQISKMTLAFFAWSLKSLCMALHAGDFALWTLLSATVHDLCSPPWPGAIQRICKAQPTRLCHVRLASVMCGTLQDRLDVRLSSLWLLLLVCCHKITLQFLWPHKIESPSCTLGRSQDELYCVLAPPLVIQGLLCAWVLTWLGPACSLSWASHSPQHRHTRSSPSLVTLERFHFSSTRKPLHSRILPRFKGPVLQFWLRHSGVWPPCP